jgi:drug/metabolite transporter (DMT)-like permease
METGAPPKSRIWLGILFMCIASTLFPLMNGLVQILGPRYATEQIVWARALTHLVFIVLLFAPKRGLVSLIRTAAPKWQLARSMMLLISTVCFFTGVQQLPLANAAAISFTAPLIVALLAWPMLGERVKADRLVAIMIGFLGVLVVVRPGSAVFQWSAGYILVSATSYAFYQIFTRKVAGADSAETSAVYSALLATVVMSAVVPFVWKTPQSLLDVGLLASLGILGGLGHYCVARAMSYAAANIVAPFQYWQLVGSVAVGYAISSHWPDAATWAGAAIIIAAGLYIGWRATRPGSAPVIETTRAAV